MSELTGYDENALVNQVKLNDERAFRKLFDFYHRDIYSYSITLLKSKDFAEENVQETFLKVWLHRKNLDASKSFKSFLYTIARNQAFNILNKAANDIVLKQAVFYESQKSYDEIDYAIREQDCNKIQVRALKQLPPKRGLIFEMARDQDMSYQEISDELGISVQTVKNQMSKALESMRMFLKAQDGIL